MKKYRLVAAVFLVFAWMACGGDDDDTSSTGGSGSSTVSLSFPQGMAVASPTASGSGATPAVSFDVLVGGFKNATVDAEESFVSKKEAFDEVLAAATETVCEVTLPNIANSVPNPECYGPTLDYCDHDNFAGTQDAACDNADGQQGANDTDGDGQLPSGDLGIWTATATGSEACTAAKINSLIQSTAIKVDAAMLLQASMLCLMKRANSSLPASGETVTLTSDLNETIEKNNSTVTITTATIENLGATTDTDGSSHDVYKYTIVTTVDFGGRTGTVTGYMKHMPTNSDNTTYKGKIWAQFPGGMQGDLSAYSITYQKTSETDLKYRLQSADYQAVGESATIFSDTGDLQVDGDWTGNFSQALINVDPGTGLGDFSYAWQAGRGDDKARIFNGFTNTTDGCGFFGYGGNFNPDTGAASDNVIDGFVCNWAGPGNNHSMQTTANLSQKQCLTVNTSTGVFEVDAAKNNISYAPTVSCNKAAGGMGTKLSSETSYSTTAVTNNLVNLTTDTDYANYSAPAAPSLPSGF